MNKRSKNIIYSTIGIVTLFLIIVAINFIVSRINVRLDLTQEKIYTLSQSTKNILKKLDTPVTLKFYYTKSSNMPSFIKNYAERVIDLLNEYRRAGGKNIVIEKYDPVPDSEAEDSAVMDGISGQVLDSYDKVYFGIAVQCIDQTVALPFLSPEREELLEYDLSRAISQVTRTKKSIVGVMSALPVMGQKPSPMMMQMGQFNQTPPWLVIREMKNDYEVREVPMQSEQIDPSIELLVIIYPAGISEKTQFAIDQYVLKGGKVIAFLDSFSYFAAASAKNDRMAMMQPPMTSSNMEKLLKGWNITFNQDMVVADMTYGKRSPDKKRSFPTIIDIPSEGMDKDEVFLSQLRIITEWSSGTFSGEPDPSLKKTILLRTTTDSHLLNSYIATNPEMAVKEFKPDDKEYSLAIKLSGKFKTAFPDGKPAGNEPGKPENKDEKPVGDFLKESQKDGVVVLVGDSDMLFDEICVRRVPNIFGQTSMEPLNDNLSFFLNLVEYMTGDSDLIQIRSRKVIARPFSVLKAKLSQAEQKYKNKILELEEDLEKAQERLSKLQEQKAKNQKYILSPEQKEEIKNYKQKEAKTKQELKVLRKELRQDIDSLENKLKWFNIALMPIVVILFGIGLAIYRNRRSFSR